MVGAFVGDSNSVITVLADQNATAHVLAKMQRIWVNNDAVFGGAEQVGWQSGRKCRKELIKNWAHNWNGSNNLGKDLKTGQD